VPKDLTGRFRVTPTIDTGPFESKTVSREIQIRGGRLVPTTK